MVGKMVKKRKGIYPTRGLILRGIVVSDKAKKTVIVQRNLVAYIPKYQRYARKISKIAAHNPPEINAQLGDEVEIAECRKISKTKAWIVTKIIKKGSGHVPLSQLRQRDQVQEMQKHKQKKEELIPSVLKESQETKQQESSEESKKIKQGV
jgi:small subunit ribosomal protein S17